MPKKKLVTSDEPLISRPQRNTRAKKVFDPSDVHIPKKRNKFSTKSEGKKSMNDKKKIGDIKSNENFPETPVLSTYTSPVDHSEILKDDCFMCDKILQKESIDCTICFIKAHRDCIIISEPIWRFKLDLSPWFCKPCRSHYCSKCLEDDTHLVILRRCSTCDVGYHKKCFELYDIKPLQMIKANIYICIPCMTLATQRVPEVEDEELTAKRIKKLSCTMSSEDNYNMKYNESSNSNESENPENDIRKICLWTPTDVYNYFSPRVPQQVAEEIKQHVIDGRAALLLKRKDITSMNIKLGHAMKFYKEVRILQTQKSYYSVYWD